MALPLASLGVARGRRLLRTILKTWNNLQVKLVRLGLHPTTYANMCICSRTGWPRSCTYAQVCICMASRTALHNIDWAKGDLLSHQRVARFSRDSAENVAGTPYARGPCHDRHQHHGTRETLATRLTACPGRAVVGRFRPPTRGGGGPGAAGRVKSECFPPLPKIFAMPHRFTTAGKGAEGSVFLQLPLNP